MMHGSIKKGRPVNFFSPTAQSSAPAKASVHGADLTQGVDDEDIAIGCECANPALQIDVWRNEESAQPLQQLA